MNFVNKSLTLVVQMRSLRFGSTLTKQNCCRFSFFNNNCSILNYRSMSSKSSDGSTSTNPGDNNVRERARKRIAEMEAEQKLSPNSPLGIMERTPGNDPNNVSVELPVENNEAFARFENNVNPVTGEANGPTGPEPTRFGDWERKGRCSDF